jgi:hypothetical protein
MATPNKEKISRWINGLIAGKSGFDRIELWHSSGKKGSAAPLHTVQRDEGIEAEEDAEKILDHARNDAATLGDIQIYRLLAFREEDDSAPVSTLSFRIEINDVQGVGGNDSSAVVGQVLRHNEAMQRIHAGAMKAITDALIAANKQAHDRNAALEERHAKSLDMIEAIITQHHEREMDLKRQEASDKRADKLLDTAIGMAPALIAKVAGKNGIAPALKLFLETLTPSQIESLAGVLTPEQMITLSEMSDIVDPPKEEK